MDAAEVQAQRRSLSDPLIEQLAASEDPALAYKSSLLAGLDPNSAKARSMRERIPSSAIARALLRVFEQDAKTLHHTYRKWQGPHWTLMTASFSGQEDRVRHCASMDGNAIWYSVRLGLEQDRTRDAVDRLIGWQWPDGGWNCDKHREATHSSFQESLIPARGLWAYGRAHDYPPALQAAQRVADLMLQRRLLWHRSDDSLIVPDWAGKPGPDRIHYPIQFFDVLFALQVMADLGRLADLGCSAALGLLESKWLPGGGFPLEAPNTVTADHVMSRGSYADWGPAGLRRCNPLVTLAALAVLRSKTGGHQAGSEG